ncbi:MAG: AMP-binding protein, partial [Parachlamydiaceae bacterium]
IVLFSTFPANVDEINDFLRKSGFSNLARISSIIQVKEIPLMGSGKTNYRVLEAEYLNRLFA